MNIFECIAAVAHDFLIFLEYFVGFFVVLLIVIVHLPEGHPARRILNALALRIGAFLWAGTVAIPVEGIPGLDLAYNLVCGVWLTWYVATLVRDVVAILRDRQRQVAAMPRITVTSRSATDAAPPLRNPQIEQRRDKASARLRQ